MGDSELPSNLFSSSSEEEEGEGPNSLVFASPSPPNTSGISDYNQQKTPTNNGGWLLPSTSSAASSSATAAATLGGSSDNDYHSYWLSLQQRTPVVIVGVGGEEEEVECATAARQQQFFSSSSPPPPPPGTHKMQLVFACRAFPETVAWRPAQVEDVLKRLFRVPWLSATTTEDSWRGAIRKEMNRKTRNGGLFEAVASPADRKQHCHKRLRPEVLEMAPSLLGKWRQENQEQLYAALHPAIGPTQVETVIDGVGLSDAVRRLLYANTVETGRRVRGRPPKEEPPQKGREYDSDFGEHIASAWLSDAGSSKSPADLQGEDGGADDYGHSGGDDEDDVSIVIDIENDNTGRAPLKKETKKASEGGRKAKNGVPMSLLMAMAFWDYDDVVNGHQPQATTAHRPLTVAQLRDYIRLHFPVGVRDVTDEQLRSHISSTACRSSSFMPLGDGPTPNSSIWGFSDTGAATQRRALHRLFQKDGGAALLRAAKQFLRRQQ